jgi:hypothetical protein
MRMMSRLSPSLIPFLIACGGTDNPPSVPPAIAISQLTSKSISLPGATLPISYDYLAIDRSLGRV